MEFDRIYNGYQSDLIVASYDTVYDRLHRDDVDFYVALAKRTRGSVLELGCGTGRILVPTAAAGASIAGVDLSSLMLNACRRKVAALPPDAQKRVLLAERDMTDFELGRRFALITIPFRAFSHLTTIEQQLACLHCIRRHLEDKGELVFDFFQPILSLMLAPHNEEEVEDCPETPIPGNRTMRRTSRFKVHSATQIMDVECNYYVKDKRGVIQRLTEAFPLRYFFRYEVENLLARAGFEVSALFGWYDSSPLSDTSRDLIFVARKAS